MSPAIRTLTRQAIRSLRREPGRELPAEKFLDLDLQHHDPELVNDFNTPNSTTNRQNDLQKLFTKGNGPRTTRSHTKGTNSADLQRNITAAICRRSSSSCTRGKQRNHNTGGGRAAVIMPTGHSPQRPELFQGED